MANDDNGDRDAILSRRQKLIAAAISTALIGGSAQACACLSAVDGGQFDAGQLVEGPVCR